MKPFVKRQKNDMADAEAICEAAQRPTMRFVGPKSAEAQGATVIFRTRDLLVRQRTQLINALRGHLGEFGFVVRQGAGHVAKLVDLVAEPTSDLPAEARPVLTVIAEALQSVQAKIAVLDREIAARAKANQIAKRLMTIPGVGPIVATALVALAPPASTFRRGRDFAAWLGLTPKQHSSGGKERLGRTSKRGERSLRRLLILGASSAAKVAARDSSRASPWLAGMLARKPRMLVTVALANKMARIVWALMAHGGSYRAPAAAGVVAPEVVGEAGRSTERYGATVRDGVGKTREMSERLERAKAVWTRPAISIQASGSERPHQTGRTHGST